MKYDRKKNPKNDEIVKQKINFKNHTKQNKLALIQLGLSHETRDTTHEIEKNPIE
jgi:hypothetical protein